MKLIGSRVVRAFAVIAVPALLLLPASSHAQSATSVWVGGGPVQYDLSGTGWTAGGAVRVVTPLWRGVHVDPGIAVMQYRTQGDTRVTMIMPEAQAQLEILGGGVRPYLGAGAGAVLATGGGGTDSDWTLSAAGGVRARLNDAWRAGAELRVRAVSPFGGTTADWFVLVGRRI